MVFTILVLSVLYVLCCMLFYCSFFFLCFFFFKQKTAYELRISDWSSDVCSSDLCAPLIGPLGGDPQGWPFARRKSASRQTLRPDSPEASMRDQLFSHPGGAPSWISPLWPNIKATMAIAAPRDKMALEHESEMPSKVHCGTSHRTHGVAKIQKTAGE